MQTYFKCPKFGGDQLQAIIYIETPSYPFFVRCCNCGWCVGNHISVKGLDEHLREMGWIEERTQEEIKNNSLM
jgi:uncharacterized Zn finger protein